MELKALFTRVRLYFDALINSLPLQIRIVNPVSPFPDIDKEKPNQTAAKETDAYFSQLQQQWL